MAGSLNKVMLIGNVGGDPTFRDVSTSQRVANFSIATSESWKDKATGEKKERVEWHRIVVWNDGLIGVIEKYVKKGSKVMVEGQLQTRKWEKDGQDHYSTEVVLTGFDAKLLLLGDAGGSGAARDPNDNASRPGNNANGYGEAKGKSAPASKGAPTQKTLDDEIPF